MKNTMNRETYLEAIIKKAIPLFDNVGFKISDIENKLKVSCSFIQGVRGSKNKAVGVHYNESVSADGYHEMMIEPSISDSQEAIGILIHEMTHAIQRHMYGYTVRAHGKEFRKIALAVGLCGKMTSTDSSPELIKTIDSWITELGNYPHSKMTLNPNRKKQGVRNLKVECQSCEWSFRTSNKNILLMASTKCLCCGDDKGLIVTM